MTRQGVNTRVRVISVQNRPYMSERMRANAALDCETWPEMFRE